MVIPFSCYFFGLISGFCSIGAGLAVIDVGIDTLYKLIPLESLQLEKR